MELVECIGNTPLIELPNQFTKTKSKILVKLEEYNWGASIKARVGFQMIFDAELNGIIDRNKPESVTILEATGGNTGIGLAQVCALRGYNCVLTVPDNYSKVRVELLKQLGAKVIWSDHKTGNDSHIKKAFKLKDKHPDYIYTDQTKNFSNVNAHYLHTGNEILSQSNQEINYFVSGIGSGGTISGVGKAIKEKYPSCKIIGVQPKGCDVLNGIAIPHKIEGFAIGKIPEILNRSIIDEMIDIDFEEVVQMKYILGKYSGLYLGYSSIANIIASLKVAQDLKEPKVIATISPDGGRNY
jgi:cysteine synthase